MVVVRQYWAMKNYITGDVAEVWRAQLSPYTHDRAGNVPNLAGPGSMRA